MNSDPATTALMTGSGRLSPVAESYSPISGGPAERQSLFKSLNEALAAELVCALRRRIRQRLASDSEGAEASIETGFQFWADFQLANRMAERIAQLGGRPERALENLGATDHGESERLVPMAERVAADLAAERAAAALHTKLLVRLRISDPGTSVLLCELLVEGEEQLRILSDLVASTKDWHEDHSELSAQGSV
jgi:bacterioferritin